AAQPVRRPASLSPTPIAARPMSRCSTWITQCAPPGISVRCPMPNTSTMMPHTTTALANPPSPPARNATPASSQSASTNRSPSSMCSGTSCSACPVQNSTPRMIRMMPRMRTSHRATAVVVVMHRNLQYSGLSRTGVARIPDSGEHQMRFGMRLLAVSGAVAMAAVVAIPARRRPAPLVPAGHDWTQFGWDVARSSASSESTGIDSATVSSLHRQQVPIDGIVDASVIYLHGVSVQGATHDVFFMTTSYGKTLAVDADSGSILWEFTPQGYADWAGSRRVTTSTPAADPDRQSIYAASPDGHVQKLAISDGHALWSTAFTRLPRREKIASPLTFFRGTVIAVTGGYIGDAPPYQGHVAILDAGTGKLEHVWNSLCSNQRELLDPESCRSTRSAIWGRAGAVVDTTTGHIFIATGNGPWNGSTDWSDATLELNADATQLLGNFTPTNTEDLAQSDRDVGSTSHILLGEGLVAQGGKDGTIRLLDWQ